MASIFYYYRYISRQFLFVLFVGTFTFLAGGQVSANVGALSNIRINYSCVDKPLSEFLESIKLQSSWTVHVNKPWIATPVSLTLKGFSIENGLQEAFRKLDLSYALAIDSKDKYIQVYIPTNQALDHSKLASQPGTHYSVARNQQTVVPPENDNLSPPTEKELSAAEGAETNSFDPLDMAVVPPEDDNQPVMTERDLLQLKRTAKQNQIDLSEVPDEQGQERSGQGS